MKRWLRDAPIRHKLVVLGLLASTCALVVASLVFLVTTYAVARRTLHDNIVAQSEITGANVTAALAFGDTDAAADTLRALQATPSIDLVCLWNAQEQLFAAHRRIATQSCPTTSPPDHDEMALGHIEIARGITVGGRRVGALYLRANLNEVSTRMRIQAVAVLAALMLGAAVAVAFAVVFQRIIAGRLTALASMASDISRRGDYSVRAEVSGNDELGQLILAFNDMLQQIERRDDDLRAASRVKDEFLAVVSHELRTPLNAILGWSQIVWNLLSNAIKFTPKSGRVVIRLRQAESNVEIAVSDSGIGIDPEFLPHVFERFRQADSSTTRARGGLGLGLAIVRHLTEAHGGTVSAHSEGVGSGSTFTVRLPVSAVGRDVLPERRHRTCAEVSLSNILVLVVDDEADARDVVAMTLQAAGAEVCAVGSANEAISLIMANGFHALVADIGMPIHDGYWLIRAVRALPRGRGGRTPAIALTAYASRQDEHNVIAAGYDRHLAKPVEPDELCAVVAGVVGRMRDRQHNRAERS